MYPRFPAVTLEWYSAVELSNLIEAAERVCGEGSRQTPGVVLLKKKAPAQSLVASA